MFDKKERWVKVPAQFDNSSKDDTVTVYVWSSGFNSLGHVAMKFSDDPGDYLSIWPKSTPAGGFTSIWPLKAALARKLEDDCIREAVRPKEDFADLVRPPEILPVQPDRVFVVHGIDKSKMRAEFARIENGCDTGEVSYQLLPRVKMASYLNIFLSKHPKSKEVYNCVTLTEHLLEVGGKEILPKNLWSTPSNFADRLSKLEQVKQPYPAITDSGKPGAKAFTSIITRLKSPLFSDDYARGFELTDTSFESYGPLATSKARPRLKVAEPSFSFFGPSDKVQSFLRQREDELDVSYVLRMDAISN